MKRISPAELESRFGGKLPPGYGLRSDGPPSPDSEAKRIAPAKPPAPRTNPAAKPKQPARSKNRERWRTFNRFARGWLGSLSRAEAATWVFLFSWADAESGLARTARAELARRIGADPRTVTRALASLENRGFLDRVRAGRQGRIGLYRCKVPRAAHPK